MPSKKKTRIVSPHSSSRSSSRRRMLKGGILAGAALPFIPGRWTRPIVESVVLPAHAQTSCPYVLQIPGATVTCEDSAIVEYEKIGLFCSAGTLGTINYGTQGTKFTGLQPNEYQTRRATDGANDLSITVYDHTGAIVEVSAVVCGSTPEFNVQGNTFDLQLADRTYTVHYSFKWTTDYLDIDYFTIHQACC